MRTLINALVSGQREYLENGDIVTKAPTATELRAARELQNLSNVNDTNLVMIETLQRHNQQQLQEILTMQVMIQEYQKKIDELKLKFNATNNESVCASTQETSDVGSGSEQPSGSDSDSEGRGTN